MPDIGTGLGDLIKELRKARGWSQTDLAARICLKAERDKRAPRRFWLHHLATVLEVSLETLEATRVKRRQFIGAGAGSVAAAILPAIDSQDETTAFDLFDSISAGDRNPLSVVQTSHHTDILISALASQNRPSVLRLARWSENDDSPVLRVNAVGIIAKTRTDTDLVDLVPVVLAQDTEARRLYTSAVIARVGDQTSALANELTNTRDAGARWCAANLLSQRHDPKAKAAIISMLRTEPVRENVRSYALMLNGESPCI